MKLVYWCLILALVITCFGYADIIHVPGDYPTIQAGIAAVSNGDTVLVANGTYIIPEGSAINFTIVNYKS